MTDPKVHRICLTLAASASQSGGGGAATDFNITAWGATPKPRAGVMAVSSGIITIPVSGMYEFQLSGSAINDNLSGTGTLTVGLKKAAAGSNSFSAISGTAQTQAQTASSARPFSITGLLELKAGERIVAYMNYSTDQAASTVTFHGGNFVLRGAGDFVP